MYPYVHMFIRYRPDSEFHVLVTSYQMLVQDEKYFSRLSWEFMVRVVQ